MRLPASIAAAVRGGIRQAADSLRGISAAGWQAKGQHPRLGEISAREVVEHFILDHLREHLKQARAAVGA